MNELIKSEAENYAGDVVTPNFRHTVQVESFTAGFNRCLELAKMDNEEALKAALDNYVFLIHPMNYGATTIIDFNQGFLAAAKLKDVEIMHLERMKNDACTQIGEFLKMNKALEEKLKVSVEALEKIWDNDMTITAADKTAYEALEKIKGTK